MAGAALAIAMSLQLPAGADAPADFAVTDDGPITRHDGGTDAAVEECGDPETNPAADNVLSDGDSDSNDGSNRRQGNEPAVAIDPTNPDVIVAGWNDYCQNDLDAGWMGLGFSTDRGTTWTNSSLPGYPTDDSAEGALSPLKGRSESGDPVLAFDNDGRLFVGGIAFNRDNPSLGDVFVSTYAPNPGPSGVSGQLPKDYVRTVRVGQRGTPGTSGIFQDKPMIEVDRSTASPHEGNVYFCWSRFQGNFGRTKIHVARSTDHGAHFSRGTIISDGFVSGCDIAIEHDGDVYVSWEGFILPEQTQAMSFARSVDGGRTFAKPKRIAGITPFFPTVGGATQDCGDGEFFCEPEGFVFHRAMTGNYRLTADQTGEVPGVFATWNAVDPASIVPSTSSYSSAGRGRLGSVGRGLIYVAKSVNNGLTWSPGKPVDPSPTDPGHQYFADIDAYGGKLVAVWQDSRTDDAYDVQLPIGNQLDPKGRAVASGTDAEATFAATSADGVHWVPLGQVSAVTHQPQYEMFGGHDIPFQGDYSWASIADSNGAAPGGLFAYLTWTDNRNVVSGVDPRETAAEPGFIDGFDVKQCDTNDEGASTCENAGGQDQDIYGTRVTLN